MSGGFETDEVYRLETNLDDCSGELLGATIQHLLRSGALDVWFTPIHMKKNRPGVMLSVLCEEGVRDVMTDIILTETTAFGIRVERIHRVKLARKMTAVETEYGQLMVKLGLKGDRVVQVAPEFENVRAAAERAEVPFRLVYEAALRAYELTETQVAEEQE